MVMIDGAALREKLVVYGEPKVREMRAEGRFGADKHAIVDEWLRSQAEHPITVRRWHGSDSASKYQPTSGDMAYRNAMLKDGANPFEEARLLRSISHEYLSVLLADNSGERSSAFRSQLEAELSRVGSAIAIRANRIAIASLVVSVLAALTAVLLGK